MSTPAELRVIRGDFALLDTDGSGFIQGAELSKLLEAQLGHEPTHEQVAKTLAQFDLNKDGQISFDEYVCWLCPNAASSDPTEQLPDAAAGEAEAMFAAVDADKSGKLNLEELLSALAAAGDDADRPEVSALFKRLDVNGDGAITMDEWRAGHSGVCTVTPMCTDKISLPEFMSGFSRYRSNLVSDSDGSQPVLIVRRPDDEAVSWSEMLEYYFEDYLQRYQHTSQVKTDFTGMPSASAVNETSANQLQERLRRQREGAEASTRDQDDSEQVGAMHIGLYTCAEFQGGSSENGTHHVAIGPGKNGQLRWLNRAGQTWMLALQDGQYQVSADCPHFDSHKTCAFRSSNDSDQTETVAIVFAGKCYERHAELSRVQISLMKQQQQQSMELEQSADKKEPTICRLDFYAEQPHLLQEQVAGFATRTHHGLMNGAFSLHAYKVRAVQDYFIHFCTHENAGYSSVIATRLVQSKHTTYCFQSIHKGDEFDKIEHNQVAGCTKFVLKHPKCGVHAPMGYSYIEHLDLRKDEWEEDLVDPQCASGIWTESSFSLGVQTDQLPGRAGVSDKPEWGVEFMGRYAASCTGTDTCKSIIIEVPWRNSLSSTHRQLAGILESTHFEESQLELLSTRVETLEGLKPMVQALMDNISTKLSQKALRVGQMLAEVLPLVHEQYDQPPSIEACAEVFKKMHMQLSALRQEEEEEFTRVIQSRPPQHRYAFVLRENSDDFVKVAVGQDLPSQSIDRCWVGKEDCVWGGWRDGKLITEKVNSFLKKYHYISLGSTETNELLGSTYNLTGVHHTQATLRTLVIEFTGKNACITNGGDIELAELRSVMYESEEVRRNETALRKRMNDLGLALRGDAEECDLLLSMISEQDACQTNESRELYVLIESLQQDLCVQIKELDKSCQIKLTWLSYHTDPKAFRSGIWDLNEMHKKEHRRLDSVNAAINSKMAKIKESVESNTTLSQLYKARMNEFAEEISSKGFSLRQLLEFVATYTQRGLIHARTTTVEVVQKIVIPESRATGSCYADVLPGGPKSPQTLMSHWWGNSFMKLVQAICQHASGRIDTNMQSHKEEDLEKTYWLCIFGVNQHHAICHSIPMPCPCKRAKVATGRIRCQMDKFSTVMQSMPNHALALDSQLKTLRRVWVLSEIDEAMISGKETAYCGIPDPQHLANPVIPSITKAEASYPEDIDHIVGEIRGRPNGVANFDLTVKRALSKEIALLHVFHQCGRGGTHTGGDGQAMMTDEDVQTVISQFEKFPLLINAHKPEGNGQTILQQAARHGHLPIVQFLLSKQGLDINARSTSLGWTALHYAAICNSLVNSATPIISSLLEANADPALENAFGRTPLEEALCVGIEASAIALLETNTDAQPKEQYMIRSRRYQHAPIEPFAPHPRDEPLFKKFRFGWCSTAIVTSQFIHYEDDGEGGHLWVLSKWNPSFLYPESSSPVPVHSVHQEETFLMAKRIGRYVSYRWPGWTFNKVTTCNCGHSGTYHLQNETFQSPATKRPTDDQWSATALYKSCQFAYP